MSALEWHWLKQAQLDRQERPGGGGFTNGEWRKARETHAQKIKAKDNG